MPSLDSEPSGLAVAETTFLVQPVGQLTVYVGDSSIRELAMTAAADLVSGGENLVVVDCANSFDPYFVSKALSAGVLLERLHILRAFTHSELEETILTQLERAFNRFSTRYALISGLLDACYDPGLPTREAARLLGRLRAKLEKLVAGGAQIVVLCYPPHVNIGPRSHFLVSLCSSADRVFEVQQRGEHAKRIQSFMRAG